MMYSKKGVSGLIVAVLLVAVSLTIGGLVISWISGYTGDSLDSATEEAKVQDECFEVDFKVISVKSNTSDAAASAKRTNNFNVTVENKNTEDVKGFLFKYVPFTGDNIVTVSNATTSDALSDYGRKTFYHHTGMDAGVTTGFKQVEISPIIDVVVDTTVETVCTSKTKIIESSNFDS